MPKWEYMEFYQYEYSVERTIRELNDLGNERWELIIGIPRVESRFPALILKRQKKCEKCGC